jgi:hypothetical protein
MGAPVRSQGNIFDIIANIQDPGAREQAQALMQNMLSDGKVHVLSKIGCPYCAIQKQVLTYRR